MRSESEYSRLRNGLRRSYNNALLETVRIIRAMMSDRQWHSRAELASAVLKHLHPTLIIRARESVNMERKGRAMRQSQRVAEEGDPSPHMLARLAKQADRDPGIALMTGAGILVGRAVHHMLDYVERDSYGGNWQVRIVDRPPSERRKAGQRLPPWTKAEARRVARHRQRGASHAELARRFGRSSGTIRRMIEAVNQEAGYLNR